MNRITLSIALGALVVGSLGGLALARRLRLLPGPAQPISSANSAVATTTVRVALFSNRAEPSVVLLETGGVVEFVIRDGQKHNISQGQGNDYGKNHDHAGEGIASGLFGPEERYRLTFKQPGIFFFHDDLAPDIFVTVIVTQMASSSAASLSTH